MAGGPYLQNWVQSGTWVWPTDVLSISSEVEAAHNSNFRPHTSIEFYYICFCSYVVLHISGRVIIYEMHLHWKFRLNFFITWTVTVTKLFLFVHIHVYTFTWMWLQEQSSIRGIKLLKAGLLIGILNVSVVLLDTLSSS